jgi:hypothetical protein
VSRDSLAPHRPVTVVDWVSLTREPNLRRVLFAALGFLLAGVLLVVSSQAEGGIAHTHPWLSVCGVLAIVAGAVFTIVSLVVPVQRDAFVAIRMDGLVVKSDGEGQDRLSWDAIADVHHEGEFVYIVHEEGRVLSLEGPFEGATARELARRIGHAQRLALWNRLSPATLEPFKDGKV